MTWACRVHLENGGSVAITLTSFLPSFGIPQVHLNWGVCSGLTGGKCLQKQSLSQMCLYNLELLIA